MTTTRYSIGEEIANAITHGIGALLSIAGLAVLVSYAALYGDAWHVVSTSIFGATLVLLYAASTVYHSVWHYPTKRILQRLDHSAIFLLIAGTYTPFVLVNMRGPWGWTLFGIIWSMALLGIALQLFPRQRNERLALLLYLGMGWMAVVAIKPFLAGVETGGLILLLTGGLFYTLGVIFYVWQQLKYHHAIWHGFVLAGSAFHFFAVLFYVVPDAPPSL
ncbi:MAG: hemolysin III family protein [Thiogranum sp.]